MRPSNMRLEQRKGVKGWKMPVEMRPAVIFENRAIEQKGGTLLTQGRETSRGIKEKKVRLCFSFSSSHPSDQPLLKSPLT